MCLQEKNENNLSERQGDLLIPSVCHQFSFAAETMRAITSLKRLTMARSTSVFANPIRETVLSFPKGLMIP